MHLALVNSCLLQKKRTFFLVLISAALIGVTVGVVGELSEYEIECVCVIVKWSSAKEKLST